LEATASGFPRLLSLAISAEVDEHHDELENNFVIESFPSLALPTSACFEFFHTSGGAGGCPVANMALGSQRTPPYAPLERGDF